MGIGSPVCVGARHAVPQRAVPQRAVPQRPPNEIRKQEFDCLRPKYKKAATIQGYSLFSNRLIAGQQGWRFLKKSGA